MPIHPIGNHISKTITHKVFILFIVILFTGVLATAHFIAASAAGTLTVDIIAGYNLVVDSNVSSTSTYAPTVATVIGKFCNTGGTALTNVYGYIGDHTGSGSGTPGIYPTRDSGSDPDFQPPNGRFDYLYNTGEYSFTHLGGEGGLGDASRYIGNLAAGECKYQYWHFTYPRCENNENPPCSADPVWGASNNDYDDLRLSFDIWGKDGSGSNWDAETWTMTLRNEISAMANKIKPNPDGMWFNIAADTVAPGELVTTNGIHYELGVINQGFDNNGDGTPDYNAWLQPIGDPTYDPSCFRLIRTSGTITLTRSGGNPDYILNFDENLYFTNLPSDNTGGEGVVYYTFMTLKGPCFGGLSPYQEVASGSDNEKFNADYGSSIPPISTYQAYVDIDKSSSPDVFPVGGSATYTIPFLNDDSDPGSHAAPAGNPGYGMPLIFSDTVPSGMTYTSDSITWDPGNSGTYTYVRQYSTNGGLTWNTGTPPAGPNASLIIQWRVNEALQPGDGGEITLNVGILASFPSTTVAVTNKACAYVGDSTTSMDCATKTNPVSGINSLGDTVWSDNGTGTGGVMNNGIQDGTEGGIANISVSLYWDQDGDGVLDTNELLVVTTTSLSSYAVIDGDIDLNGGGIGTDDDGALQGVTIIDGRLDIDRNGSITTADDGTFVGYNVYDGRLDIDRNGSVTTADDGNLLGKYQFNRLPDAKYLVVVDTLDTDLPTGYGPTTPTTFAIDLDSGSASSSAVTNFTADFGFGPSLEVVKTLVTSDPAYEGELVTFNIDLKNLLFGDGTSGGNCKYIVWATINPPGDGTPPNYATGNRAWQDRSYALNAPDGLFAYTYMDDNTDELGLSGFNLSNQGGNITKVEFLVYVKELKNSKPTNALIVQVFHFNAQIGSNYSFDGGNVAPDDFPSPVGTLYKIQQNITGLRTWVWSDFANNTTEMELIGDKGSGSGSGDIALDAAGYIITTDQTTCGGSDKTISYLPLTDTYDSTYLEYVTASPEPSTVTAGQLTWSNLGPLYAGGTRTVAVTFRAKPVSSNQTTTDTATVTNPEFASGRRANDGTDSASVGLRPAGSIKGYIWSDNETAGGTGGWYSTTGYSPGDSRIANVKLDLYGCVSNVTDQLIYPAPSGGKSCTKAANNGRWVLLATTYTDGNGYYIFDGLRDGFYNINAATPTGFATRAAETTPDGNGLGVTCPNAICDGWWNTESANLNTFNSVVGDDNIYAVSFAYSNPTQGAVTGYVWYDADGDGVWDSGEQPISGVTVYLCTGTGSCTGSGTTTTTDANGNYTFTGLSTGTNYRVGISQPGGTTQTGDPDQPNVPCTTCDNQNAVFTVTAGQVRGPYNFGYDGALSVGDTVYADWDGDGSQDSGEEGISGVIVHLYRDVDGDGVLDSTDPLIDTQTTDSNGNYSFAGLPGGGSKYIVRVLTSSIPTGYAQTGDPDESGACSTCDSTHAVTLTTSNYTAADFGYQPRGFGSIGDLVWRDSDGNGAMQAWESGINSVSVRLYQDQDGDGVLDAEDALVKTTTTNSSGIYGFANLFPGDYTVEITPTNFNTGQPLNGLTMSTSGTAYNASQVSYQVALGDAETFTDADFGFTSSAIGNLVWQDNNGDGLKDDSEPGISGVVVNLYEDLDNDGDYSDPGETTPIATATTNANGEYYFTGLDAGDYIVELAAANFNSGGPLDSSKFSQTYDPDAYNVPCTGTGPTQCDGLGMLVDPTAGYGLALGQVDYSRDFGYQPLARLGETVWINSNGDSLRDSNESGIANITINLWNCGANNTCENGGGDDSLAQTTATDSSGYYSFGNLTNGTYEVIVSTSDPDFPSGLSNNYDPDGTTNSRTEVVVSGGLVTSVGGSCSGDCSMTANFGYIFSGSYSISGTVFRDGDQSGNLYEGAPDDSPYENITVYLYACGTGTCSDGDEFLAESTTTDANGNYSFTSLPAGLYRVAVDKNAPAIALATQTADPNNCDPGCMNYTDYIPLSGDVSNQDYGFYVGPMDCGDLLDENYKTLVASQGACHVIVTGSGSLYLGSVAPDAEPDGWQSPYATGDNLNGENDEGDDYRDLATKWVAGGSTTLDIPVYGDGGYLVGWFDWNNDGVFSGAYETVVFGAVSDGLNTFSVYVPTNAEGGYTTGRALFVRYRLYSGTPSVISPTGTVFNGEVEDYQYLFGPTAVSLSSFTASSPGRNLLWLGAIALMVVVLLGLGVWRVRYKRV